MDTSGDYVKNVWTKSEGHRFPLSRNAHSNKVYWVIKLDVSTNNAGEHPCLLFEQIIINLSFLFNEGFLQQTNWP